MFAPSILDQYGMFTVVWKGIKMEIIVHFSNIEVIHWLKKSAVLEMLLCGNWSGGVVLRGTKVRKEIVTILPDSYLWCYHRARFLGGKLLLRLLILKVNLYCICMCGSSLHDRWCSYGFLSGPCFPGDIRKLCGALWLRILRSFWKGCKNTQGSKEVSKTIIPFKR